MSGIRKLNGTHIGWIANRRNLKLAWIRGNYCEIDYWTKAVEEDHHTPKTQAWTNKQCQIIEMEGWDAWLTTTGASEGPDKD